MTPATHHGSVYGAFAELVTKDDCAKAPAAKYDLVLLASSNLALYARQSKACACTRTELLPCPHVASIHDYSLLGTIPLDSLCTIYLPYATRGSAVATRRSDLLLHTTDQTSLWLAFPYNAARGAFLDALVAAMAPLTVPVESLDLDDGENAALVPQARHVINFTYPSPNKMAAYVPRRHDEARDGDEGSSEPEVDLDLCHRHASAYEAQIMTLYMQLDASNSAAPSSTASILHTGLQVALVQHLKHALELEAALQSASAVQPMAASLLLMVLEFALRLELVDVQIAATLALAVVNTKLSRFTQAHAHVETGLRLGIEIEHRTLLFVAYLCLCDLYVAQRHAERAIEFLHRAKDYALPAWKLSFHANLQILQAIPPVPFSEKLEAWWGLSDERAKSRSEVRTQFGATVLESLTVDQLLLALPLRSVLVKVDKLVQYRVGYEDDWTVRDLLRAAIQRHERGQSSSKCLVGFRDPSTSSDDRVLPLHLPLRQCRLHLGLDAVIEPRSTLHAPTATTPNGYISCSLCQQSLSIDAVEEHSQICFQQRHQSSWSV
ncbi:hypothetical protein SPRG_15165 [Saprolegnia parasitica CBS 223.65]|uniref:SWIM-type domain-containing protein n=1 Tax=Saprolegnia parasitica (strain CBS 223.65) TaxID=695850 RepID=A0A067BVY0_SAPPC|nr:hypothetical protein SPRG_15165 [Saprolegnia parasitica CBS 223.65]KDO18456.1 hypothetical protein SPRG_15165 [Saprolegnia parasitica CBS 223.65]|eukprot:XP_012210834.1 hypothetical protein SPRG_15165 [Saprolegnia parasitica CBS 223.65]